SSKAACDGSGLSLARSVTSEKPCSRKRGTPESTPDSSSPCAAYGKRHTTASAAIARVDRIGIPSHRRTTPLHAPRGAMGRESGRRGLVAKPVRVDGSTSLGVKLQSLHHETRGTAETRGAGAANAVPAGAAVRGKLAAGVAE